MVVGDVTKTLACHSAATKTAEEFALLEKTRRIHCEADSSLRLSACIVVVSTTALSSVQDVNHIVSIRKIVAISCLRPPVPS